MRKIYKEIHDSYTLYYNNPNYEGYYECSTQPDFENICYSIIGFNLIEDVVMCDAFSERIKIYNA